MGTPALVLAHEDANEAVERRLRDLESKPRLDLETVERAVRRIRRPEALGDRLGPAIRYSQRVEAEVAELGIETLLPHAERTHVGRFLAVWTPDELGHAHAQEVLLRHLGVPAFAARSSDAVPWHNRLAGYLGRLSARAHDMVAMIYHAIGAINEKLAMSAYERMARICTNMGEGELAEVLFAPMRRDEAGHLGYYRTTARQLRRYLRPWQMSMVRAIIVHTYAPVGAGDQKDKAPFGECLLALEEDPGDPAVAKLTQAIAEELLAQDGRRLAPFVHNALQDCLNLASQPAA